MTGYRLSSCARGASYERASAVASDLSPVTLNRYAVAIVIATTRSPP
jgi:hypothetical protein